MRNISSFNPCFFLAFAEIMPIFKVSQNRSKLFQPGVFVACDRYMASEDVNQPGRLLYDINCDINLRRVF